MVAATGARILLDGSRRLERTRRGGGRGSRLGPGVGLFAALAVALAASLATAPPALAAPRVVVSPSNGLPGATVKATATGFPVGPVTFWWDNVVLLGTADADSQNAVLFFQIPAGASLGEHFVRACGAAACPPGDVFDDGKATVVAPTAPPPTPTPAPPTAPPPTLPPPTLPPPPTPTLQPTPRPTAVPSSRPRATTAVPTPTPGPGSTPAPGASPGAAPTLPGASGAPTPGVSLEPGASPSAMPSSGPSDGGVVAPAPGGASSTPPIDIGPVQAGPDAGGGVADPASSAGGGLVLPAVALAGVALAGGLWFAMRRRRSVPAPAMAGANGDGVADTDGTGAATRLDSRTAGGPEPDVALDPPPAAGPPRLDGASSAVRTLRIHVEQLEAPPEG